MQVDWLAFASLAVFKGAVGCVAGFEGAGTTVTIELLEDAMSNWSSCERSIGHSIDVPFSVAGLLWLSAASVDLLAGRMTIFLPGTYRKLLGARLGLTADLTFEKVILKTNAVITSIDKMKKYSSRSLRGDKIWLMLGSDAAYEGGRVV